MNFIKETTAKGVFIPRSAFKVCGFDENAGELSMHTLPSTLVLLKREMTVMEVINAIHALSTLSDELFGKLVERCDKCTCCDVEGCPLLFGPDDDVELPDWLREEAGIPQNASLCYNVDEDNQSVTISAADYAPGLDAIPQELLERLVASGICLEDLEDRLVTEDVICDG